MPQTIFIKNADIIHVKINNIKKCEPQLLIRVNNDALIVLDWNSLELLLHKIKSARHSLARKKAKYTTWTIPELERLKQLIKGGLGPNTIAQVLNKTPASILAKTQYLGYHRTDTRSWSAPQKS